MTIYWRWLYILEMTIYWRWQYIYIGEELHWRRLSRSLVYIGEKFMLERGYAVPPFRLSCTLLIWQWMTNMIRIKQEEWLKVRGPLHTVLQSLQVRWIRPTRQTSQIHWVYTIRKSERSFSHLKCNHFFYIPVENI